MATKRQKLFMTYFLSKASFFGIGYSRLFNISSNDTWISIILGTLIGIIIVYIISKFMDLKKGTSLKDFLNKSIILKCLIIILCSYIFLEEIMVLTNFMTSFFLLKTPNICISIPILVVIIYILNKGLRPTLKTNEILFYISIFITIITFLTLLIYPNYDYLRPVFITSYSNILKSSLLYTTYSTIPLLLLTNLENDGKSIIKMYLVSSLRILLLSIFILSIFGPALTKVYRFPEYIVLKRIKILSFIEKIESLLSIIYIFDNYILMLLSSYTINSLLGSNKIAKVSFYGILIGLMLFGTIFLADNYYISLKNYYLSPFIYSLGYLILFLLIIKAIKKKPKASDPT